MDAAFCACSSAPIGPKRAETGRESGGINGEFEKTLYLCLKPLFLSSATSPWPSLRLKPNAFGGTRLQGAILATVPLTHDQHRVDSDSLMQRAWGDGSEPQLIAHRYRRASPSIVGGRPTPKAPCTVSAGGAGTGHPLHRSVRAP